jgi:WD40 repeat protein
MVEGKPLYKLPSHTLRPRLHVCMSLVVRLQLVGLLLAVTRCALSAQVQVWDLASRKVIRSYEGHGSAVNCVLFHPDGTCIASGSADGSLKVGSTRAAGPTRACWQPVVAAIAVGFAVC